MDRARRALRLWLIVVLLLGLVPIVGQPLPVDAAATRTVSPNGTDAGNCTVGACRTIAYALSQATPGDTISLAAGTYHEHDININTSLSIVGQSAASTIIDAGGSNRTFYTDHGTVTFSGMTIRDGNGSIYGWQGGAISNSGATVSVTDSVITGNSGGGIVSGGTLTLTNSTVSGNAGSGIVVYGTATVSASTVHGNAGGGILVYGTANISNSTIGNNTGQYGGLLSSASNAVTVTNVTTTGNASGGLVPANQSAITAKNSLIADGCAGLITSGDYNIDGGTLCGFGQAHDHTNATDPHLGALTDNGGPTPTIALLPGSLAINAASNATCPVTDQRGIARPQGGTCDIGAYEFTAGFAVTVPSVPEGAGNPFSITLTNADAAGTIVTGYTGTVHFTSTDGQATLPTDYLFTGGDAGVHTFPGIVLKTAGIQRITATDTVTPAVTGSGGVSVLAGVQVTFGFAFSPLQPVANVTGAVTVTATDAYGNTAAGYRGTVHFTSNDSQATLPADYTFTSADAGVHTFLVTFRSAGNRTFTASQTPGSLTATANVTVVPTPVAVYVNRAWIGTAAGTDPDGPGPATRFGYDAFVTVADALYFVATGGTIYIAAGTYHERDLTLTRDVTINGVGAASTILDGNQFGRVFYVNPGVTAAMRGITIQNGTADGAYPGDDGGGIYNYGGTLTVADSILTNNAALSGGGIKNYGGIVTLTNTTISGNTARHGPAIYNQGNAATLINSTVSGNIASDGTTTLGAGAIENLQGALTLINSTVSGNTGVSSSGGILLVGGGTLALTNVTITGNAGAGIYSFPSANTSTIRNTIIGGGCQGGPLGASGDYNLETGESCGLSGGHNLTGMNPQLAPLANNGGPTQTHALLPYSPAINAAGTSANGCPATDQRGVTRPQRGACDIGAFEFFTPLEVTAPGSSRTGDSIAVTVTAKDMLGNTQSGYTGTVHFTSSDGLATLPADYSFAIGDHGTHTLNATLRSAGTQTITATDTVTGAITGNVAVIVRALPPTIVGISPSVGLPVGGNSVTITGANFQTGAAVAFGGVTATSVSVVNSTTMVCLVPAHPVGDVSVTVTNPDTQAATLPNGYSYAMQSPQPQPRPGGGLPPGTPVNPIPGGR